MANSISTLWAGIVADLNTHKTDLGISGGAEMAEKGKVVTVNTPGATVWIAVNPSSNVTAHGVPVTVPVDVVIFCVATPDDRQSEAVDAALDIAVKVVKRYAGTTIASVCLTAPDTEPVIDVVEKSSNAAVVGVLLKGEVKL